MEHGNMLAIVGSPGSGKTTLAVKLATEIAKKKKNVIVVCSDPFVPSVPFLLPMDTEQEVSLGALLTAPSLTQNKILEACVPVPANEYISLLGYRMGENLSKGYKREGCGISCMPAASGRLCDFGLYFCI